MSLFWELRRCYWTAILLIRSMPMSHLYTLQRNFALNLGNGKKGEIYFKFISLQWDIFSQNKLVPLQIWVISSFFFRRILSGTSIMLFWRIYRKGTRDKMWSVELKAQVSLRRGKSGFLRHTITQMIVTVRLTTISDLKKNFYFMNTDKTCNEGYSLYLH